MKHILLILLALTLVACGAAETERADSITAPTDPPAEVAQQPTEPPTPTELPDVAPTADANSGVDVEESAEQPDDEAIAEAEPNNETPSDIVESTAAAQTPTDAIITRSNDHFKGAAEPDVVLVEYGDFQ